MTPQIFISHAAKDSWVEGLRDALHDGLAGSGYKPLLDKRELPEAAGDPWSDELHEWIYACHAAVILLDSRAKDSNWVHGEACWLRLRASRDKLYILPVGCDVSVGDLPPILAQTAGLNCPQWLPADRNDVPGTIAKILRELKRHSLTPTNESDPWSSFVMKAVALMASVTARGGPREDVRLAAGVLRPQEEMRQWGAWRPWAAVLAEWLFVEDDLEKCGRAIGQLALSSETKEELLNLVAMARLPGEPLRDVPSLLAQTTPVFALHPNASAPGVAQPTNWQLRRPFRLGHGPTIVPVLRNTTDSIDDPAQEHALIEGELSRAVNAEALVEEGMDRKAKETAMRVWRNNKPRNPLVFHVPVYGSNVLDIERLKSVIGPAGCCLVSQYDQTGLSVVGADTPDDWAVERAQAYKRACNALKS